jgi:hypothetical protein
MKKQEQHQFKALQRNSLLKLKSLHKKRLKYKKAELSHLEIMMRNHAC